MSEVKISNCDCASNIVVSLGFKQSYCVFAKGKFGSLLLMWKDSIDITMITTSDFFLNCLVLNNHAANDTT